MSFEVSLGSDPTGASLESRHLSSSTHAPPLTQ
jgi:hypothetical protein